MTVKELISKLQSFPPDAFVAGYEREKMVVVVYKGEGEDEDGHLISLGLIETSRDFLDAAMEKRIRQREETA